MSYLRGQPLTNPYIRIDSGRIFRLRAHRREQEKEKMCYYYSYSNKMLFGRSLERAFLIKCVLQSVM